MNGDVHVRFCERLGVKLPGATHQAISRQSELDRRKLAPFVVKWWCYTEDVAPKRRLTKTLVLQYD